MIYVSEIILLFCIIVLTLVLRHVFRRRKHPPGPLGLPIFGMLPFQFIEMLFTSTKDEITDAEKYKQNKKIYGPIWSAEFGKQRIVTLSSWDLIYEAFIENAELFSGRPTNSAYKLISHGKGIILIDGEIWRASRQLAIKSLRDLGMGKKTLGNVISNETDEMVLYLEKNCSTPVNINYIFTKGATNVIMRLVFDETDAYDDFKLEKYAQNLRIIAHSDSASRKAALAPRLFGTSFMKWLCPEVHNFLKASDYCYQFIRRKCESKRKQYGSEFVPDCVHDHFLRYRFTESSSLPIDEQKEEIIHAMYDLFNAGVDTTSNLLTFCCLMLGKYQEVQKDLRQEINEVIEDSGYIDLEARKRCPKVLSFIDEVHRFCCIVPKVHHRVMKECVFHDYKLYPDDIVFGDFSNLFSDPILFENPEEFKADRFIDKSGTKYCPSKYLIPFGIGKRSCLGESIALMESFIFLVRIIRRFHISLPEEMLEVFNFGRILKGHSGIVHAPLEHFINVEII